MHTVPADQVQEFACRGQTVKYMCKCEGNACPKKYCGASQCEQQSEDEYFCDMTCSPTESAVQCPAGKIPRFVKSFPTCPEHTPRYKCRHFDKCESAGGRSLSLPPPVMQPAVSFPAVETVTDRRTKNNNAVPAASSSFVLALPLCVVLLSLGSS